MSHQAGVTAVPHGSRERLFVVGYGDVGRALASLAQRVDFEVIVCDDNHRDNISGAPDDGADAGPERFESCDPHRIDKELGPLGKGDFVAIVTRNHRLDQQILEGFIGNESLTYLGFIGSQHKVAKFRQAILDNNKASASQWARVHAPIGIAIRAKTPDEIAIAITAELIEVRNSYRQSTTVGGTS